MATEMIASLHGIIASKSPESVVMDVSGVGYQVFIPLTTYYQLPDVKEFVHLHIHTHVREDTLQLYGFSSPREKQLFILLMGVSGVGPKLACNILSRMDIQKLVDTLRRGSVEQLRSIPGIGPKMAGRLVLELKEKAAFLDDRGSPVSLEQRDNVYDDTLSALIHLGYPEREAKQTLDKIGEGPDAPLARSVEGLIKQALRLLSKVN